MLVFFGCLFLVLGVVEVAKNKWVVVAGSFFIFSFFCFFDLYSYGWMKSSLFLSWDVLSSSLVLLSFWMGSMMIMANWKVLSEGNNSNSFVFSVVFLILVLLVSFYVSNFLLFYVFFEFSLIPTFFIILGWGYQPERLEASMYMVIYTVGASLPLFSCLLYTYFVQGHLSYYLVFLVSFKNFYGNIFFFVVVVGFLVKIPVFFFHLWLPKAHVEAPVAGSMILAGVLLKLGGYGMMRVVESFGKLVSFNCFFYMSFVLWGGVITSIVCFRQVDLKGLIAYSSIGHMGLFVGGVLSNNSWGWQGGLLMLLAHGLCSPAMFALANIVYESVGSRSMVLVKGMVTIFPFMSFFWFLICSSNMAAPPSVNLSSEVMLFVSVLNNNMIWGICFALISFLSGGYSLYLYVSTQHGGLGSVGESFLCLKSREYFIVLSHWFPLNVFVLSLGGLVDWA